MLYQTEINDINIFLTSLNFCYKHSYIHVILVVIMMVDGVSRRISMHGPSRKELAKFGEMHMRMREGGTFRGASLETGNGIMHISYLGSVFSSGWVGRGREAGSGEGRATRMDGATRPCRAVLCGVGLISSARGLPQIARARMVVCWLVWLVAAPRSLVMLHSLHPVMQEHDASRFFLFTNKRAFEIWSVTLSFCTSPFKKLRSTGFSLVYY